MTPNQKRRRAFTLPELLVLVAVAALLLMVFWPAMSRHPMRSKRIQCVNNLKTLGLAFRVFAEENHQPSLNVWTNSESLQSITPSSCFKTFSKELATPRILYCPADRSRSPAPTFANFGSSNVSYFVNLAADESRPLVPMAGDRNVQVNGQLIPPGIFRFTTNQILSWSPDLHGHQGNILLGDGSVQQTTQIPPGTTEDIWLVP